MNNEKSIQDLTVSEKEKFSLWTRLYEKAQKQFQVECFRNKNINSICRTLRSPLAYKIYI